MKRKWLVAALAALAMLLSASCCAAVENIADQCRFLVSEGSAERITDEAMGTAWRPENAPAEVRVMLPDGGAAWIQIHWSYPPENYTMTEYDASQAVVATHTLEDDEFNPIALLLPLHANTKYVFISFNQPGQGINKIRVFPEGELPPTAVQWEKPHDKCDLLVVSTHQDDEWLWFGAMIPYYDLVKDKDVQVVYMANCGRMRYAEALNSIAVSGVRTYPMFVGLTDQYDDSAYEAIDTWGGKEHILGVMTAVIRRFRPEVILTHDWDGEYGHPQHILTSRVMEYAIAAAADPNQFTDSAKAFGTWQVKKLYRHLEERGRIEFDWHVAYPEFGGRTGIQVATDSMNEHASQLYAFHVEDHGKYDNALFGLSYSTVGDDALHNDLFENVPETTATPIPTATPTPTPEPTPDPTPEAAEADSSEANAQTSGAVETIAQADGSAVEAGAQAEGDAAEAGAQASGSAIEADAQNGGEASTQATGEEGASEPPAETAQPTSPPVAPPPRQTQSQGSRTSLTLIAAAGVIACAGSAYLLFTRSPARRRRRRQHRRRK